MKCNSTQRPSPSSPQEQAEPHLEAGEGLDVTACSASSFCLEMWLRKFDPLVVMTCACSIGGFIGISIGIIGYAIWNML